VTQDDLTPWQDTPLVQALTAGGAADELSGEDTALAAFRASTTGRRRRGVVRFLGTGATSIALLGVVGGGVAAAAYTRSLPPPVQSALHDALGPIGVPGPAHHKPHKTHAGTVAVGGSHLSPSTATSGSHAVSASPAGAGQHSPAPSNAAGGPAPSGSAGPQASISAVPSTSPTPTPTPSPTAPAGDPSTWTISSSTSSRIVRVHDGVQISGTLLDADGQPVADHRVLVRVRVPGSRQWDRAAVTRTDANGSIEASLSDLTTNKIVVLAAGSGVHSAPLRIVVKPVLSVSVTRSSDGTSYVVTVSADGGNPGDAITLLRHTPGGWQQAGHAQLDGSSSASFAVQTPQHRKRYLVRLPATSLHAAAVARLVLPPRS
jgi:hypothetical protein